MPARSRKLKWLAASPQFRSDQSPSRLVASEGARGGSASMYCVGAKDVDEISISIWRVWESRAGNGTKDAKRTSQNSGNTHLRAGCRLQAGGWLQCMQSGWVGGVSGGGRGRSGTASKRGGTTWGIAPPPTIAASAAKSRRNVTGGRQITTTHQHTSSRTGSAVRRTSSTPVHLHSSLHTSPTATTNTGKHHPPPPPAPSSTPPRAPPTPPPPPTRQPVMGCHSTRAQTGYQQQPSLPRAGFAAFLRSSLGAPAPQTIPARSRGPEGMSRGASSVQRESPLRRYIPYDSPRPVPAGGIDVPAISLPRLLFFHSFSRPQGKQLLTAPSLIHHVGERPRPAEGEGPLPGASPRQWHQHRKRVRPQGVDLWRSALRAGAPPQLWRLGPWQQLGLPPPQLRCSPAPYDDHVRR